MSRVTATLIAAGIIAENHTDERAAVRAAVKATATRAVERIENATTELLGLLCLAEDHPDVTKLRAAYIEVRKGIDQLRGIAQG